MKKFIFVCMCSVLAVAAYAADFETFKDKKVIVQEGLVNLYESDGKIYMEIPRLLLGKRLLTGTMVESCSDMLESNVGYQPVAPYIVSFDESHGSLILSRVNDSYVSCNGGRNMSVSNIDTVERIFDIKEFSPDSTSFLVDATSYFLSHDKSMDPIDPKAYNAAEGYVKRTGSYVPKTTLFRGFAAGDDYFSVSVSNSYKVKAAFLGVFAADEQSIVTSVVRRSFVLLENEPMMPLEYNPKVGTYSVSLEEYDEGKPASAARKYAVRWRLDTDDSGMVSSPVCFYVDEAFPVSWRQGIFDCVEQWNTAFEKIGLGSALEAKMYSSDEFGTDSSDIRFNFIRYNLSPAEKITDSRWCDPFTGELLGAGIVVNHGVSELIKKNLLLQVSAGCEDARSLQVDSLLFIKALKSMMMRHMGHCLGLCDNMAGSHAFPVDSLAEPGFTARHGISASVMDELPFNFVAYSSENVQEGTVMIQDTPGEYDLFALSYLYGGNVSGCDHYYGARQKLSDFYDPRSMSFDLGDDAVRSVEKGFEGLACVVSNLNEWIGKNDWDYNFRECFQEAVVLQAYEYIKQVFVNVGGIYVSPKVQGDSQPTYRAVPKELQKGHLNWALNLIDDLSFLDDNQLKKESPLRGDTGEFCQKYFTNFIFVQIDAMWLSEIRSSDPYTQEEALRDVAAHIWKGAEKGAIPTDLQKYQRLSYIENLISWAGVRGNYYFREPNGNREISRPDKTHIWYGMLLDTKKLLEKACARASSPEAESHYRYLLHHVSQYL